MRARSRRGPALERDLARLADGSVKPHRRELVDRVVAASDELQVRLRQQRRAVRAVRAGTRERAPLAVRMGHRRLVGSRARTRRPRTIGISLGLAAALTWALAAVGGGQSGLTVAQAATIAARPGVATVREPPDGALTLPRVHAAGLAFPYWEQRFGWRATGLRHDRIAGRLLTTVFYRRAGQRIAYTIVSGGALPAGAGVPTTGHGGAALVVGDRLLVTWLRRGHTCVLSGRGVPVGALLELTLWSG